MDKPSMTPFGKMKKSLTDLFGRMAMAIGDIHVFSRIFSWMSRRSPSRSVEAEAPLKDDPAESGREKKKQKAPKTDVGLVKTAGRRDWNGVGVKHLERLYFETGVPGYPAFYIPCLLEGVASPVKFVVSTGMPISVISLDCVERCGILDRVDRRDRCRCRCNERELKLGTLNLPVRTISGYLLLDKVAVVRKLTVDAVLGTDFLSKANCALSINHQNSMLIFYERD